MALFKKKEAQASQKPRSQSVERSLPEIVHERILTAEGWRRKTVGKTSAAPKKTGSVK